MEGVNGEAGPTTKQLLEDYAEFVKVVNLRTYILFLVLEMEVPADVSARFTSTWQALRSACGPVDGAVVVPSTLAMLRSQVCGKEILADIAKLKSISEVQKLRGDLAAVMSSDALIEKRKAMKAHGSAQCGCHSSNSSK